MDYMGVAMTALDRQSAEKYMDQVTLVFQLLNLLCRLL